MKIAITTPTGHVGHATADYLLDFGPQITVRLLGRRPERLRHLVERGAETAVGSNDDADYLVRATRNVDALLWVTPPGYGSDDVRAFQNRLARAAAEAIRTNKIARVVNLSSMGAEHDSGVGPIGGLHDVEEILNGVAPNLLHLRPGFFMENLLWQVDMIRRHGRFSLPLSPERRYPMIATRDIGRVAAQRLATRGWTGQSVYEVQGPADMSFAEVAETLTGVLGREISYVRCEPQQLRQAMLQGGLSENAADLMLELYAAAESGKLHATQPRRPQASAPTTLAEFAREVIVPAVAEPVKAS